MSVIFKYPLVHEGRQQIMIPENHRILDVQLQRGILCLWAEVDEGSDRKEVIEIHIVGTGQDMPLGKCEHISTVQQGEYVWHIFRTESP